MIGTSFSKRNRRSPRGPLTCNDLAEQGRWNLLLCCSRCHEDPRLLIEEMVTASNPFEGTQIAHLCCNAFHVFHYVKDWHGESVDFPEHEE